jgi:hypothetical protein
MTVPSAATSLAQQIDRDHRGCLILIQDPRGARPVSVQRGDRVTGPLFGPFLEQPAGQHERSDPGRDIETDRAMWSAEHPTGPAAAGVGEKD